MTKAEILEIAKPALFNTDMTIAILENRKSATRRLIKPPYFVDGNENDPRTLQVLRTAPKGSSIYREIGRMPYPAAKYKIGDYLYVRETWANLNTLLYPCYYYRASDTLPDWALGSWHPSIHMPKEAARIFLRVTDVRVERLQDITEEQAIHEGICRLYDHLSDDKYREWANKTHINAQKSEWGWKNYLWHGHFGRHGTGNTISDNWEYQYSSYDDPIDSFSSLWNSTVPLYLWSKYGWSANPWVWVIEFERVEA